MVTMKPIPQQKGASDCGLFAISAAFQSAAGLHSSTLMCHYKGVGIKRKPKSFVCATCRPS